MPQSVDTPATILVVEDNREVLTVIERILTSAGHTVHVATDGEAGLAMALDLQPDLIVLDIGLPKRSGLDLARDLRERAFLKPVLMLTARDTVTDKVTGLDAGADDYIAKPFDANELVARVRALLRRAALRAGETIIHVADLALDPFARQVSRGGQPISLTQKEYALLEYLMRNAGRAVTREMITEQVWKQAYDPSTNIVDVYINYLRKKIDSDGRTPQLIHTVRGVGYVLSPDPAAATVRE